MASSKRRREDDDITDNAAQDGAKALPSFSDNFSYLQSEMIYIHLKSSKIASADADEPATQVIPIQKTLLCADSEFFRSATKPEWQSLTPHKFDLTDEDPDIFMMYAHFLYTKRVLYQDERKEVKDVSPYKLLIWAYILGERLLSRNFRNAVIGAFVTYHNINLGYPGLDLIRDAYSETPQGSPLRRLLVDLWVKRATVSWKQNNIIEMAGAEFVEDLVHAFLGRRPYPSYSGQNLTSTGFLL